ncbi:MAG TPA: GNAT family N-acetyltransferase [Solirubrobacterales bacterium]|nr:GNAT family N-acetyltransferase [Solirubrobacterales bacterium]
MSGFAARARLLEDRGEAAVSDQFFRSREFLDAEGVTHTLKIEGDEVELVGPLVVREIDDTGERDGVSPYSFPGLVERDGGPPVRLDPAAIDYSGTGLVSVFIRHTLGEPPLSGSTPRNVVQIADPTLPPKSRPSDRRQIRRNLEVGYGLELVAGPETSAEQRGGFVAVYEETMRRTAAAEHYFFGGAYFDRLLEAEGTWLALATAGDGTLAAASLAVVSDGFLHYYLSGSADSHLGDSPMKNVVARLIEHSAELGLPLNLGGGITNGDALEEFKRGFANREEAWRTSEIVCDPAAYERLSAGRAAAGFFPAYRA